VDFLLSPALAATRLAKNPGCRGVGEAMTYDADPGAGAVVASGAVIAVVVGLTILSGFLSYQAGKAMTPRGSKKSTWGWVGVPVGMFTGATGLGVMGWVSNAKKK